MAPSKLRKAIGAVKDKTSIGLAKVSNTNSLSDLDVAIVKATRHDEYPAEERHIREILSLTSYSRTYVSSCINTISRRLNKTKNWTVALKTLILVQRLLAEGDPAYEQEIFFSTRRGTRLLNMSDFRDTSHSNSWDYSAFVRTYALYLDERLEFKMLGRRGKRSVYGVDYEDDDDHVCIGSTPVREMKNENIFSKMQHLQQLLERFLACRPTGEAKNNRVVIVALYPIVKESFQVYYDITEIMGVFIDRFMDLEISDCVKTSEFFCRARKQFNELEICYKWCNTFGIARSSEYPEVEKISQKKLDLMDDFIRERSAADQGRSPRSYEGPVDEEEEEKEKEDVEDMNTIKALPAPEVIEESVVEEEIEVEKGEPNNEKNDKMVEGDLLNLGEDMVTSEEHGDKLTLALFDGGLAQPGPESAGPGWQAFGDDNADWETALVQTASNLQNQKTSLGGGFDMLLLDGMYQQALNTAVMASGAYGATGSASSVAFGSAGRPASMLALPAPPGKDGNETSMKSLDPFAASLAVAPPSYVQMSDMEKKQKMLLEEQIMWQQYTRDGMQGHLGMTKLQGYPYNNAGGHMHSR